MFNNHMSEEPTDNEQLPLPTDEDIQDLRKQADELLGPDQAQGSRSAEPEIEAQARRAAMRIVGDTVERTDVYEDLGGGNPEKRRIDFLKGNLVSNMAFIESEYLLGHKQDQNIYMLHHGLLAVAGIADTPGWSIEKFVAHNVEHSKKMGDKQAERNATIRTYDSLGVLDNAMKFLPKSGGERSEEHVQQFTGHNYPSALWQDETLRETIFESVDNAHQLLGMMSSPDPRSIEGFISKLRFEFIRQGLGWKIPRRRDPSYAGFDRNLRNARTLAWGEFKETTSA
jgi:hypothetical protein